MVTPIKIGNLSELWRQRVSSGIEDGEGSRVNVDRNTKKVRFREGIGEAATDMLVELMSTSTVSWKDKLLENKTGNFGKTATENSGVGAEDDLEFLEGDILRCIVNGIPAIDFSERIQQILFKEMDETVVLKLLGKNVGYGTLNNQISSFWRPTKPFQLNIWRERERNFFL
ncbi:hypothetical protein J1N35_023157 [Gossypium stocksii]|uniref:Uncharacterized protein n=1 Tax=Gossypium stocksii TaxID=47602 RepID=A0A9D3VI96_9ROSI|nr:hypothetical protein J1N35_023157 [Gossypium stocksii]